LVVLWNSHLFGDRIYNIVQISIALSVYEEVCFWNIKYGEGLLLLQNPMPFAWALLEIFKV